MFMWEDENIRWMEDAAAYTRYYVKLAAFVLPYLKEDDHVCEIGCGLGHLAASLAPHVRHVTAIDSSPKAIESVSRKKKEQNIRNLTLVESDWRCVLPPVSSTHKFDVVLFNYFSAIRQDFRKISESAKRHIIAVLPRGESGTNLTTRQYGSYFDTQTSRETVLNVVPFLEERNLPYTLIPVELEFGQPVRDLADGEKFVSRYYKGTREQLGAYLKKHLIPMSQGYYLPKLKKSGVIVINLKHLDDRKHQGSLATERQNKS